MGFIKIPLLAMPVLHYDAFLLWDVCLLAMHVLHKYIPVVILNNNQSILGLLDVLTEKLSLGG